MWARAGASFGEADGEDSYYQRDGITHVELSATLPLTLGPVKLSPVANLDLGIDGETRVVAPARTRRAKLWLGTAIAWPGGAD